MSLRLSLLGFLLIIVAKIVLHLPGLQLELQGWHNWRQTYTQSNITNFYEEDFNILNPRKNNRGSGDGIYRMEFPLMQWLTAATYKVFGPSLKVTRLVNLLFSITTLIGIFCFVRCVFKDNLLALIGVFLMAFAPSFFYFSICPLPDNLALTFGVWGLYFSVAWNQERRYLQIVLGSLFLGLSALCKLPFILFFALPFGFFVQQYANTPIKQLLAWSIPPLLALAVTLKWYAWVVPTWQGNGIVQGLTESELSVTLHYTLRNFVGVLPELIVGLGAVLLLIAGIVRLVATGTFRQAKSMPYWLLWVALSAYVVFEANMIKDYHDYYLFPFYPLTVLITVYGAQGLLKQSNVFGKILVGLSLLALPIISLQNVRTKQGGIHQNIHQDYLTHLEELRNAVPKKSRVIITNDYS